MGNPKTRNTSGSYYFNAKDFKALGSWREKTQKEAEVASSSEYNLCPFATIWMVF